MEFAMIWWYEEGREGRDFDLWMTKFLLRVYLNNLHGYVHLILDKNFLHLEYYIIYC